MGTILLLSALVRVAAMALSLGYLYRHRRWQILILTTLTGLMATRQGLTLSQGGFGWLGGPWITELPGLLVSFLVLGVVVVYNRILQEDRHQQEQARSLQESVADLAREAEEIIAHEGWGLVHIAERATEALEVDRMGIWWFSPDRQHLRCTEHYDRINGRHTAGEMLDKARHGAYFQALEQNRVLAVTDPTHDPRTAELRPYLQENGITALLNAPILFEGHTAGMVCFEHTSGRRHWNDAEGAFAGSIADLVALARTAGRHRERAERLAHQAYMDPLTGLVNWQFLQERLQEEVDRERRNAEPALALLYIDLDQFRYINDTQGHEAGDRMLAAVAKEIIAVQPPEAVLGRVGGDEFVLAVHEADPAQVEALAASIRDGLARMGKDGEAHRFTLSASIGAALLDAETRSAGDLLAGADLACNQAKEAGRNQIAFYQPGSEANELMSERLAMFQRIRRALDEDRFRLVYQPIRGLKGHVGDFHEVLLRMEEDGHLLSPGAFLPAAERFSLMGEIDRWVVEQAMAQLARWRQERPEMVFSINLSARAFGDQALFDQIRSWIETYQLVPEALVFEITETEAIANLAQAKAMIWTLKELGCRFSLDDFGSGFASFAYLRELPVDLVKIDGHFIRDLPNSSLDHAIVRALVDIADNLGKEVVAEFVENSQTLARLSALGVGYAQGFYLGHPAEHPLPMLRRSRTADEPRPH